MLASDLRRENPQQPMPASIATSAVADPGYLCHPETRMRARYPASAKRDDLPRVIPDPDPVTSVEGV